MAYLADICALIDFHARAGQTMRPGALEAMRSGDVAVSAVTVWEITRAVSLGNLPPLPRVEGSFTRWLRAAGYVLLPLDPAAAEQANSLPPHHADPVDRMLVATALLTDRRIVSSNTLLRAYGVPLLW